MSSTPWGVDLSPTYNPTVDAGAIKAAGVSYAILKVSEGVGWPSEHTPEFDWLPRVAAAVLDAGLQLRVYHLATPSTPADALAEALWFDRHLGGLLPESVAYDLEQLAPNLTPAQHAQIFNAWRQSVAGFLPGVPIEFYSDRSVNEALVPFLPQGTPVWLGYPAWVPDIPLGRYGRLARVQAGQRTFPGVAGQVDVNVDPAASFDDVAEALGLHTPTPAPAPVVAPIPLTPQGNSDWSLTVRTLDLRNADTALVTGDSVKALQTLLNLDGDPWPIAVDGLGGRNTLAKLKAFQTEQHLTVDGIAGPLTWEALCRQ